jgi:hypothetical protein
MHHTSAGQDTVSFMEPDDPFTTFTQSTDTGYLMTPFTATITTLVVDKTVDAILSPLSYSAYTCHFLPST